MLPKSRCASKVTRVLSLIKYLLIVFFLIVLCHDYFFVLAFFVVLFFFTLCAVHCAKIYKGAETYD